MHNIHNILQGKGKAALLSKLCLDTSQLLEEIGCFELALFLNDIIDIYLAYGTFNTDRQIEILEGIKYWAAGQIGYIQIVSMEDFHKNGCDELLASWEEEVSTEEELWLRRHLFYIPFGIIYEQNIEKANPKWYRTSGDVDYNGGVDFIDFEKKQLITVKAVKHLNQEKLLSKIKTYFAGTIFSTFDIVLIHKNTKEWTAFSGVIDSGVGVFVQDTSKYIMVQDILLDALGWKQS